MRHQTIGGGDELLRIPTVAGKDEERERRQDFLRFQINEIEAVGLTLEELPEIEADTLLSEVRLVLLRVGTGALEAQVEDEQAVVN